MVVLRSFQQEIVELTHDHNVVMVGETGIGKTFVAIALLSEQDYSAGRRAFFMAPTRQLVWQITAKIRSSSTIRANAYCGQAMERWGDREWRKEMELTRVFVCTPDVVRMALERGLVKMEMINLLVFDECHHVTKRHPYAQVIKMYDPSRHDKMPRVFGVTACPTRDCANNLHAQLHKVVLPQHEKFAAIAPIQYETYEKTINDDNGAAVEEIVGDEMENWMHRHFHAYTPLLDRLKETKAVAVLDKLLCKGRSNAAGDNAYRAKLLQKVVHTAVEIYMKWGLWCLYRYVELEIERAAQNASLLLSFPGSMYGYDSAAITAIMLARARRDQCVFATSKRLSKVVELLSERTEDDESSLQGIIFVTTRAEGRVLCEYLNGKMGYDDVDRFGCVLGQAAVRDTASLNLPGMEETLSKFERGSIQFLVSTAISIEGVDFPQCALIIVADRIQTARKLIQLRGRARHEHGVVYYLAEEGDLSHHTHFKIMMAEADAINILDFSNDKQVTISQQPRSKSSMERITIASTGAVLDLDSSVSRLNKFCQSLPPQLFTVDYKNMYTFIQKDIMRRPMFCAKLQLPVELDVPILETEFMQSKSMAKASVAFLGCKYLLDKGLLDQSIDSVYRKRKSTTLDCSYFLNRLHHK